MKQGITAAQHDALNALDVWQMTDEEFAGAIGTCERLRCGRRPGWVDAKEGSYLCVDHAIAQLPEVAR